MGPPQLSTFNNFNHAPQPFAGKSIGKGKPAWSAAAQQQPPAVGKGGTEMVVLRTICQFWQQGNCKNGDLCTWAHGEGELGALAPANPHAAAAVWNSPSFNPYPSAPKGYGKGAGKSPMPAFKGMGKLGAPFGGKGFGGFGPITGGAGSSSSGGVKRTICQFFQQGTCKNGATCTWAHGDEELGQAQFTPGSRGNEKKTMCKFWLENNCSKGDGCTWAHGEDEQMAAQDGV